MFTFFMSSKQDTQSEQKIVRSVFPQSFPPVQNNPFQPRPPINNHPSPTKADKPPNAPQTPHQPP